MPASQNLRIPVQNMSCASCVGRVDRAISGLPGVDEVNVNLAAETAQFRIDSADRLPQVVQALDSAGYPARTRKVRLAISSMSCASCVGRVDKALAAVPGVTEVNVNLASETATVTFVEGAVELDALIRAADAAGYPAKAADETPVEERGERKQAEVRALARKTAFAAALA
ncbi:MAG TPA: heavy metal translocating P-type ATPase, partial [Paracoccus sp.]|nr:heavy metal translocating P-type ATPase [Paracoccus sp. (in: a-proteobacteria)]